MKVPKNFTVAIVMMDTILQIIIGNVKNLKVLLFLFANIIPKVVVLVAIIIMYYCLMENANHAI